MGDGLMGWSILPMTWAPGVKRRVTFFDVDKEGGQTGFGGGDRNGEDVKLEVMNGFGEGWMFIFFHDWVIWFKVWCMIIKMLLQVINFE